MNSRKLKFSGNHFEIGQQIGQQYLNWGKRQVWMPGFSDDILKKQIKLYQKYYPEYLEVLSGIADSMKIDQKKVYSSYLTGFLSPSLKRKINCSEVLINNKHGVLVGSNYDWRTAAESCSSLAEFKFNDGSAYNFTGISDMATWDFGQRADPKKFLLIIVDAWNEHGLYIGLNGAPGEKYQAGMNVAHLLQAVVEKCKTTDQALKMIQEVPLTDSKIFIVADKAGNLAVAEKSLQGGLKIRKSKQYLTAVNHFMNPDLELENLSIFDHVPFHATFPRGAYLEGNLKANHQNINSKKLYELMSKPPTLQNWRSIEMGDSVTVWILVLNLKTGKFQLEFSPLNKKYNITIVSTN